MEKKEDRSTVLEEGKGKKNQLRGRRDGEMLSGMVATARLKAVHTFPPANSCKYHRKALSSFYKIIQTLLSIVQQQSLPISILHDNPQCAQYYKDKMNNSIPNRPLTGSPSIAQDHWHHADPPSSSSFPTDCQSKSRPSQCRKIARQGTHPRPLVGCRCTALTRVHHNRLAIQISSPRRVYANMRQITGYYKCSPSASSSDD